MKKRFALVIFSMLLLIGNGLYGQCPVSVQINASLPNPVCKETAVTFTAIPSSGGISSYLWIINGDTLGSGTSITTSTNGAHIELYAVSDTCGLDTVYNDYYILSTQLIADYNVIVTECNQPVADVEILGITGGAEPYTYDFITEAGGQGQQDLYPDIPVSNYPLFITDANGCTDTSWINMTTIQCPPPTPTEVMTPNDDGYNDTWRINFIEFYPDNEVFIYDRWGQRVYHKKGYDNSDGWDAKYVGADMPVSTYYYVLKVNFEKSEDKVYNGPISIFR